MTATLVAKDLSGGHGHRILFEGLDLTVTPGDVIGVVGANGAGKSTLLSLLGDAVEAEVPELTRAEVRTLLAKFGLKADQVTSQVGRLSPGERTRAAMALLQARGVNLLVLDEPTNHLDLPAIQQLEQALTSYDGALLLVSHDRRLLENVRLDQRWEVDGGRVVVRHV